MVRTSCTLTFNVYTKGTMTMINPQWKEDWIGDIEKQSFGSFICDDLNASPLVVIGGPYNLAYIQFLVLAAIYGDLIDNKSVSEDN